MNYTTPVSAKENVQIWLASDKWSLQKCSTMYNCVPPPTPTLTIRVWLWEFKEINVIKKENSSYTTPVSAKENVIGCS